MRFIKGKKGALDLSINAIVVLILAITMLGLGLGFMYKMFGGTAAKLDKMTGKLEAQMKEQLKESGQRLALETSVINMKKSTKERVAYAIRNDLGTLTNPFKFSGGSLTADGTASGGSIVGCYQSFNHPDGVGIDNMIKIRTSGNKNIEADSVVVSSMEIEATSRAEADTYQCSMIVEEPDTPGEQYARVDFEVTIK